MATLLAATGAGQVHAQDTAEADDGASDILPIAYLPWQGSAEELRNIESKPVPRSLRKGCVHEEGGLEGPCRDQLLNWHAKFGSVASTTKALAFIERELTAHFKLEPGLGERFAALKPQALREVDGYLATQGLTFDKFKAKPRAIDAASHPAVAEMPGLAEKLRQVSDLARFYANAADRYRSPKLLEKAKFWRDVLQPASRATDGAGSPDAAKLLAYIAYVDEPEFLDLSLAVTHATIQRDKQSVMAAHLASAAAYDPGFSEDRRTGKVGEDWQASLYDYYRFRISLLADELGLDVSRHEDVYLGTKDLRDAYEDSSPEPIDYLEYIPWRDYGAPGRIVDVVVAQGEHDIRATATECRARDFGDFTGERLNVLLNGGRMISPVIDPAGYRRVGRLYLELYAITRRCPMDDNILYSFQDAKYAAQARIVANFIADYDHLALGR